MKTHLLSIIIPAYNEEQTIEQLLDLVAAVELEQVRKEIIIVDDGSTDATGTIADRWQAAHGGEELEVVVVHQANGGKGSAVRTGIRRSTGDVVIIQDADLEYDPQDYTQCIAPIIAGECKVVYGSRERFHQNRIRSSIAFYMGGLLVTYWFNLLYGSSLTDEPTCYKTFDGPLIRTLLFSRSGFDWEPEVTAKVLRLGYNIHETRISYLPRKIEEGKKISWRDGVQALWVGLLWRVHPIGNERRKLATLPQEQATLARHQRRQRWLWSIVAIAFTLRLLLALPGLVQEGPERFSRLDTSTYLQPAMALLEDGRYMQKPGSETPATFRPPGTSAWMAIVLWATGGSQGAIVISFCLLSALIVIPILKTGELLGGVGCGMVAAILWTLNLTSLAAAPMLLSDTLYAWFAAWQLFFFVRFCKLERVMDVWTSFAIAGVSCLIRPTGLPWILPGLFLILIFPRKRLRVRLIAAVVALFIALVIIFPWMWRNAQAGAGYRLESTMGVGLLYHNVPALLSVVEGESAEHYRQMFAAESTAEFASDPEKYATPASRMDYQLARAKPYIREHFGTYVRLHIQPLILLPDAPTFLEILGLTQTGRGTLDVLRRDGLIAAVRHYFGDYLWVLLPLLPLLAVVALTYLGCGLQLVQWLRQGDWYLGFVFLGLVPYFLVLPGPVVMPRYQLPALPMMCVMAGLCYVALWRWWHARRARAT